MAAIHLVQIGGARGILAGDFAGNIAGWHGLAPFSGDSIGYLIKSWPAFAQILCKIMA
jgi:hypothetical protein